MTTDMKIYNTSYGRTPDTARDTVKPQFDIRGSEIYSTVHNQTEGLKSMPWFKIKDNKIYNTTFNPNGHSLLPQYEIRGNSVYTTIHHPDGISHMPVFNIKKH